MTVDGPPPALANQVVLDIAYGIARGMQYLHEQEHPILHRDLKPGNILVSYGDPGSVRITDFGLSRRLGFEEVACVL